MVTFVVREHLKVGSCAPWRSQEPRAFIFPCTDFSMLIFILHLEFHESKMAATTVHGGLTQQISEGASEGRRQAGSPQEQLLRGDLFPEAPPVNFHLTGPNWLPVARRSRKANSWQWGMGLLHGLDQSWFPRLLGQDQGSRGKEGGSNCHECGSNCWCFKMR